MTIAGQLLLGGIVTALALIAQAGFIAFAFAIAHRIVPLRFRQTRTGATAMLAAATLWMLGALSVAAWLWAGLFMYLGAFDALEPSLYFATVSLTTLGFGDVILSDDVRLLSAIVAANGLLMFGLSTAFMIEFVGEVRRDEEEDPGSASSSNSPQSGPAPVARNGNTE